MSKSVWQKPWRKEEEEIKEEIIKQPNIKSNRPWKTYQKMLYRQQSKTDLLSLLNIRLTDYITEFLHFFDMIQLSMISKEFEYRTLSYNCKYKTMITGSHLSSGLTIFGQILKVEQNFAYYSDLLGEERGEYTRHSQEDINISKDIFSTNIGTIKSIKLKGTPMIVARDNNYLVISEYNYMDRKNEHDIKLYSISGHELTSMKYTGDRVRVSEFLYPYLVFVTGDFYDLTHSGPYALSNRQLYIYNFETRKTDCIVTNEYIMRMKLKKNRIGEYELIMFNGSIPQSERPLGSIPQSERPFGSIPQSERPNEVNLMRSVTKLDLTSQMTITSLGYKNFCSSKREVTHDFNFFQSYMTAYVDEKYTHIWNPLSDRKSEITGQLKERLSTAQISILGIYPYDEFDRVIVIFKEAYACYVLSTGKFQWTESYMYNISFNFDLNPIYPYISFVSDEHFKTLDLYTGKLICLYSSSYELSSAINIQYLSMCVTGYWPDLDFIDIRESLKDEQNLIERGNSDNLYTKRRQLTTMANELMHIGYGQMLFYNPDPMGGNYSIEIWDFR